MPGPWNVEFAQRLERVAVHARGRTRSRTRGLHSALPFNIEDCFGHLAARRVAGADEQDAVGHGLRARMNAPMTRPVTSRATTSSLPAALNPSTRFGWLAA